MMTFPKLARDLLMFLVSVSLAPSDPDSFSLSEPARSTRLSIPEQASVVSELEPVIFSWKTECEREERSLQLVAATARFLCARRSRAEICAAVFT